MDIYDNKTDDTGAFPRVFLGKFLQFAHLSHLTAGVDSCSPRHGNEVSQVRLLRLRRYCLEMITALSVTADV